jgi:hypothetical protein
VAGVFAEIHGEQGLAGITCHVIPGIPIYAFYPMRLSSIDHLLMHTCSIYHITPRAAVTNWSSGNSFFPYLHQSTTTGMVKIQILSDLHLEVPVAYDVLEITRTAEYLALLGDISYTKDVGLIGSLPKHLAKFKIVFYVLGNHDPYHSSYAASKQHLLALQAETEQQASSKFVLFDQTRYDLSPTVSILGCTLFSNITTAQKDFVNFSILDSMISTTSRIGP